MKFDQGKNRLSRFMVMMMIALQTGYAPLCYGASQPSIPGYYDKDASTLIPPSVNALPVVSHVVQNATVTQVRDNELLVNQSDDHAIIDWESFDIGADAHTRFDQQGNAAWSVLNRIHDEDPSQIYGSLTADGTVYLINPNGMLFNEGSTVNVHSLVASSLNMDQDDFLDRAMTFSSGAQGGLGATDDDSLVANRGSIETDVNGSVYLLSPQVENSGTIDAPVGRIVLAAGTEMEFRQVVEGTDKKVLSDKVDVVSDSTGGNVARNESGGRILSDMGKIEMYGSTVNQQGLVQTVTAIKKNGQIILQATDKIITGETSKTQNLISDSDEEVHSSFTFDPGEITLTSGGTIDHEGTITNPAGKITLTAKDRIYLSDTSSIDAGGVIADLDAEDSVVTATLNSVELKDEQQQKDGILQGADVSFVNYEGSTIGDVSNILEKEFITAAEAAVKGGEIFLTATDGDIIVRDGATLDFSGGSTHHESGFVDTTWLTSGNKAYSISNAPDVITYDSILSSYEKTYARYGIKETVSGIFTGGAMPVKTLVRDYYTGADAGSLSLTAPTIILDGSIDGTTLPGFYQTEENTPVDDVGNEYALGVKQPIGGELSIGSTSQIVVAQETEPLPENFTVDSDLSDPGLGFLVSDYSEESHPLYKTILSSETLSQAGLSVLIMSSQTSLDVRNGASITLDSVGPYDANNVGNLLDAQARTITIDGDLIVPSGKIHLRAINTGTSDESNPDYISPDRLGGSERIYIGPNAVLSAAGETVDNTLSQSSGRAYQTAQVNGGTILLEEKNLNSEYESGWGVFLSKGSVLDVSGGYEIGMNGSIDAGDAGEIHLLGANLVLDGDLYAYSLEGRNGGTIELFAATVDVKVKPEEGDDSAQGLILYENRLNGTGATHLVLNSFQDLTVQNGVQLGVSTMKMASPLSQQESPNPESRPELVSVPDDEIGRSSITLGAGKKAEFYPYLTVYGTNWSEFYDDTSHVVINRDSTIKTGPSGSISVSSPGIEVYGTLDAPAGSIALTATSTRDDMSLLLGSASQLLARGYLQPDPDTLKDDGSVSYIPLDGGNIVITARGHLDIKEGAEINVSSTDTPIRIFQDEQGQTRQRIVAANPGSVSLNFEQGDLSTLNQTLKADNAGLEGLTGGSLSIMKTDTNEGLDLSEDMIRGYLNSGFDSLSLGSRHSLTFTGPANVNVGRILTLDTPEINASGDGGEAVNLLANTIHLINSQNISNKTPRMDLVGDSELNLISDGYLDITGYMDISGFGSVTLSSAKDILLKDWKYRDNLPVGVPIDYYGGLNVSGDLNLEAARIYPTTQTEFTLHSDGTIATSSVDDPEAGSVYSAGGRLIVEAENIDHHGVLMAPMGEIVLCGTDHGDGEYMSADTITLHPGSEISVSGDVAVKYGTYNQSTMLWVLENRDSTDTQSKFETLPTQGIRVQAQTVRSEEGANLDVSGGGSVYTYLFQQAVEGSVDPLKSDKTCVLMPESAVSCPGERIYLSGSHDIREGYYVIVGEEYAFTEGAVVARDLGLASTLAGNQTSDEGYSVVVGYESAEGQIGYSPLARAYEVRDASDALAEGNYSYTERSVNDAGTLSILAATNIMNATLNGWGTGDGSGGGVNLSATRVIVGDAGETDDLTDTLYVKTDSLSGSGFANITLGSDQATENLTVTQGSTISVENLNLKARDLITVETGASIDTGRDKTGSIGLFSPNGRLVTEEGSSVTAGEKLTLAGSSMDIQGLIGVEEGTLSVQSDAVAFTHNESENGLGSTGFTVDEDLWAMVKDISALEFKSGSVISLDGGLSLEGNQSIILDTTGLSLLAGSEANEKNGTIKADTLILRNSGDAASGNPVATDPDAVLTLEGRKNLIVEFQPRAESTDEIGVSRTLTLSGAHTAQLVAGETLGLAGQGTLALPDGDLELTANVVTGMLSTNHDGEFIYKTPDALVSVGNGKLLISSGEADGKESVSSVGGKLAFEAQSIAHGGNIVLPSGIVSMEAMGSTDQSITLEDGSVIDVSGNDDAPAGSIDLMSDHGGIITRNGSTIDVSSGGNGAAGALAIRTPDREAVLAGTLLAQGGGGTFVLDVLKAEDVATLLSPMSGMDGTVYIRSRSGDMDVASDITAHDLTLVADNGAITVSTGATIDGSGEAGGDISLNAGLGLTLETGSILDASATDGDGGAVELSSRQGTVSFDDGAEIRVSGSMDNDNGTVTFRASRVNDNAVDMDLNGTIEGADSITVEARKVYSYETIDAAVIADLKNDTQMFMDAVAANGTVQDILAGLSPEDPDHLYFTPGIEIQSEHDLTLTSALDLNTFDDPVGTLTLTAAGDLTLQKNILSHPTSLNDLASGGTPDSWNIALVAGSDLTSAYDFSVKDGDDTGILKINDGAMVYSESGNIRFASRLDTILGTGKAQAYSVKNAMNCSIATFDGDIDGSVGGDLSLAGSAIQSGTGDIDLVTGGDLLFTKKSGIRGSIRTTGEAPEVIPDDYPLVSSRYDLTWQYSHGGDIHIDTAGNIYGTPATGTWGKNGLVVKTEGSQDVVWSANYGGGSEASTGILTMGGGDVILSADGNITAQAGAFGQGDLTVRAGGDLNGRFMVSDGEGDLFTAGSFGTLDRYPDQTLELQDGTMDLYAQGQVVLGSVVSPSLVDFYDSASTKYYWNPGYSQESGVSVKSGFGDISVSGASGYVDIHSGSVNNLENILPPSLSLISGGDIHIENTLSLFPSESGKLSLIADKGSIDGHGSLVSMSDAAINDLYTSIFSSKEHDIFAFQELATLNILKHSDLLHRNDDQSVLVRAGKDIQNLKLVMPEKSEIIAGRDMVDLVYEGQNLSDDDLTLISAGRDIVFGTDLLSKAGTNNAIALSGPGTLAVLAGNNMDLGTSSGIVTQGNAVNTDLPGTGSDVVVVSGYHDPFTLDDLSSEVISFFDTLRSEGKLYTDNLNVDEDKVNEHLGNVTAFLEDKFGTEYVNRKDEAELHNDEAYIAENGDINMIRSQIATTSGGDISIVARGNINVGETVINNKTNQSNGINTQAGGDIRVFAVGDVNVNESRLMAWYGGDITLWTDAGNINAGRGSRTEISPGSTTVKLDENNVPYEVIVPSAPGSGIRALTYDPDGVEGPLRKAALGDVYLFAPAGIIDAGEAGIVGNSVYLGARTVLNVQNISFSQGAVGVPMGAESSVNLGAITGAGAVGAGNQMADSAAALAAVNKELGDSADKMGETFLPTWLRVEFMGFDVDDRGI